MVTYEYLFYFDYLIVAVNKAKFYYRLGTRGSGGLAESRGISCTWEHCYAASLHWEVGAVAAISGNCVLCVFIT